MMQTSSRTTPLLLAWLAFFLLIVNYCLVVVKALEISLDSLTTEYLKEPIGVDAPQPRFSWKIIHSDADDDEEEDFAGNDGVEPQRYSRGIFQTSYHLRLSSLASSNQQDQQQVQVWDCGIISSNASSLVPLPKSCHLELTSDTYYSWTVTVEVTSLSSNNQNINNDDNSMKATATATSTFHTGLFSSKDDWNKSQWITGRYGTLFRSATFSLPPLSHIRWSTLFISGIGYYHVYWNGHKIGNNQLDPGWTDFNKHIWYTTYNLTELMLLTSSSHHQHQQQNVLSIMLGNGWFSCGQTKYNNYTSSDMPTCQKDNGPQVRLQLHINGQPYLWTNTSHWKVNHGPIIYNSLYNGEIYDARLELDLKGWKTSDFNDSKWSHAQLANSSVTHSKLESQLFEPIRHISTRRPININTLSSSFTNIVQVIDFGQNMAGIVRLKNLKCTERGQHIQIRHAEILLHPPYGPMNGSIYIENLHTAKATDIYICHGNEGNEKNVSYIPTFTQHGFRYVEVSGLDYILTKNDIEAIEMHTDIQSTSRIEFGNIPLMNDIQRAVLWGQKSNLMSVPTDCDQRDERRGWMGDAALTAEEATYNFDMGAFYTHWLHQILCAQNPITGSVPDFVPPLDTSNSAGAPNWQSAYPTIVWTMFQYYGDKRILIKHHDGLVKYFHYFEGQYHIRGGLKNFTTGAAFGDWVPPPPHPKANKYLTGSFAFLHDLKVGMDLFGNSSHSDAPSQYDYCANLFTKLSIEFHQVFYNPTTGMYASGLQTEQALPLHLGIVPKSIQDMVLKHLIYDIEVVNSFHTTCGIVGIKFLMEVLSMYEHSDVALALALQTSYPSWGYMLHNKYEPATTIWELWNSDTAGPGMNSRNHIMFGSVSSWMYKFLAGITPSLPGYSEIHVKPFVHSNLTHLITTVVTPFGDINSSWSLEDQDDGTMVYTYSLWIPPGTTATLAIPLMPGFTSTLDMFVREGNVPVWVHGKYIPGIPGIETSSLTKKCIEFSLLNGHYNFVVQSTTQGFQISSY